MKKLFPTFLHESAKEFDTIFFSAGRIGCQIETSPDGLLKVVPYKLCDLTVSPDTHGLGAIGLPGDFSSPSRFLRTAFIKEHLPTYNDITATRVAIFELLGAVSIPDGAVDTGGGKFMRTRYSSIMNQSDLTYLVRTPECSHTRTLTLTDSLASAPKPLFYPLKGCDSISDVSGSLAFTE
jgi:choloylglycine hydrolase